MTRRGEAARGIYVEVAGSSSQNAMMTERANQGTFIIDIVSAFGGEKSGLLCYYKIAQSCRISQSEQGKTVDLRGTFAVTIADSLFLFRSLTDTHSLFLV